MEKRKAKVIMLPTNKAEDCIIKSEYGIGIFRNVIGYHKGYFTKDYLLNTKRKAFHLYITTDDEIKEKDWCINPKGIPEIFGFDFRAIYSKEEILSCRKIIAATDTLITGEEHDDSAPYPKMKPIYLPKPSKAFIEKYCKVGGIDEVLVEYEYNEKTALENIYSRGVLTAYYPKIDSQNTITIHPIKDSWNRKEVVKLLEQIAIYGMELSDSHQPWQKSKQDIENWIDKNL